MDTTSLLIIGQIILLLLAALVLLALYARKQKKAVSDLQNLLLEYKEEISGSNTARYFQLSIDDTTAHSAQDTVALKPDAAPDQMAISLRYHALAAELSLLQTYNGELSPWKSAIEPYNELAGKIHDYIQSVPETVKAELIPKIDNLEKQLTDARSQYEQAKNQLDNYHQLDSVYKEATTEDVNKQQLEVQLHHALLALAEGVENAAPLREVIYLMHEGYLDAKDTERPEPAPMEPASEASLPEPSEQESISEEDAQAMRELIDRFTEESADLVERVYMLNNENKMLSSENEELKRQIKAYTDQAEVDEETAPIVAGLKMKIDSQLEEIMHLQSNFKQLEDKYLSLYADKLDADELIKEAGLASEEDPNPDADTAPESDIADIADTAEVDADSAPQLDTDLDSEIDTDLGTDTLLEAEVEAEPEPEPEAEAEAEAGPEAESTPDADATPVLSEPVAEEPAEQTGDNDDTSADLDEIDFAEADTLTSADDVDDILASVSAETTAEKDSPEKDSPKEEEEDAIDPDAILAEMEEIGAVTDSNKPDK